MLCTREPNRSGNFVALHRLNFTNVHLTGFRFGTRKTASFRYRGEEEKIHNFELYLITSPTLYISPPTFMPQLFLARVRLTCRRSPRRSP
jgi:hypothetical protein